MTSRLYRYTLAVLVCYWLTMFTLTHLPPGAIRPVHVSDKIQHFAGYIILAVLLDITLFAKLHSSRAWITLIIVLLYGAFDEMLQPLTHRTADLADWFADGAGAAAGICITGIGRSIMERFAPRRASQQSLSEKR